MRVIWLLVLLMALVPSCAFPASDSTPSRESRLDELFRQATQLRAEAQSTQESGFSPLYGSVTSDITSRISAQMGVMEAGAGRPLFALPTAGRACLTTAPQCGRPTVVGCKPKPTTGRRCAPRPTVNCNQTTAVTCGCRATQVQCPSTTAPNCGQPTTFNCGGGTTAPNCPPPPRATTAPNCR